jgi:hypothetical protein
MFNALALGGLNQDYCPWHSFLMYYIDILFIALPYWTLIPPFVLRHNIFLTTMNDQTKTVIFKLEDLQINYPSVKKNIHMILNELPAHLQEILKNKSWLNCK